MEKINIKIDGEEDASEMFVLANTSVSGNEYYLVSEVNDEDNCYILKDISDKDSEEAVFVEIEDPKEWESVGKVFQALLDDDLTID